MEHKNSDVLQKNEEVTKGLDELPKDVGEPIKKTREDAPNYRFVGFDVCCNICETCAVYNLKTKQCGTWDFEASPDWTCDSFVWRSMNTFNPLTEEFDEPEPPKPFVGEAPFFMLPSQVESETQTSDVRKNRTFTQEEIEKGKYNGKKKPKKKKKLGKCKFCKESATSGVVWADGRAMVRVCKDHVGRAKKAIEGSFDEVRDLTKSEQAVCNDRVAKVFSQFVRKAQVPDSEDMQQIVIAPVLEPETPDSDEHRVSEERIEKAAYGFMRDFQTLKLQHSDEFMEFSKDFHVVESYIALADFSVGQRIIRKGSWVLGVQVLNAEIWKLILKGELTGFSMGGFADVDFDEEEI